MGRFAEKLKQNANQQWNQEYVDYDRVKETLHSKSTGTETLTQRATLLLSSSVPGVRDTEAAPSDFSSLDPELRQAIFGSDRGEKQFAKFDQSPRARSFRFRAAFANEIIKVFFLFIPHHPTHSSTPRPLCRSIDSS